MHGCFLSCSFKSSRLCTDFNIHPCEVVMRFARSFRNTSQNINCVLDRTSVFFYQIDEAVAQFELLAQQDKAQNKEKMRRRSRLRKEKAGKYLPLLHQ